MINFMIPNWFTILEQIDEQDIYDDGSRKFGKETEPHTTVLYGFHDNECKLDDIKLLLPHITDFIVEISGISAFKNQEYDVLKFDIESGLLHQLNKDLRESFPYTNSFPEYHPHMTIAYLKPGAASKYLNQLNVESKMLKPYLYKYGFADGSDEFFKI